MELILQNSNKVKVEDIKVINRLDISKYLLPSNQSSIQKIKKIYYVGNLTKCDQVKIAIVGSRNMTNYGKKIAYQIAQKVATAGVTVVSGLMYGIDNVAHQGALDAGGRTIAVLGYGFNYLYSQKYAQGIGNQILQNKRSAIVSQFDHDDPPAKWTFPNRNLLIALMCKAVIVIEATQKSGTLITAEYALEEGRDVFALPGSIFSPNSLGTNNLIKTGATPIVSIKDLLLDLGLFKFSANNKKHDLPNDLSPFAINLYNLIYGKELQSGAFNNGTDINLLLAEVIKNKIVDVNSFYQALVELEIAGIIKKDALSKIYLV